MYGFVALLLKKEFLRAYTYTSKENATFHGGTMHTESHQHSVYRKFWRINYFRSVVQSFQVKTYKDELKFQPTHSLKIFLKETILFAIFMFNGKTK